MEATNERCLVDIERAAKMTGLSKFYLYRLPKDVPGRYRFGKAIRFDIDELRAWARRSDRSVAP
jgi:predicted DNA-binding transcriptional regulator AlpA